MSASRFPSLLVLLSLMTWVGCKDDQIRVERLPQEVTFNRDIAPIVFKNCSSCHRPQGSAPFSLLSYTDVRDRAAQIVEVTQSRFMPPWLPEPGFGSFKGVRRLSEQELETIALWERSEALEGDPADRISPPEFSERWQLGEPDLILHMPETYTLPAEGVDVFRNFVIPVPLQEGKYVRAVEFLPGNPKIVHHATIQVDDTDESSYLDKKDPAPGYDGMHVVGGGRSPDGHFLGWTPGRQPAINDQIPAWHLKPDSDLVFQLHMLPTGKSETIRSSIGLFFTEEKPERSPFMLRLGSKTIDIPSGSREYSISDQFKLPVSVQVLNVYPHAHYLGKEFKGWAELPDGRREWLLRIDDWDFNWQEDYRYVKPLELPSGSTLHFSLSYDNSSDNPLNPNQPPERVFYGPKSSDEMGDLWVQVLPHDRRALDTLRQRYLKKELAADVAGFEKMLERDPEDEYTLNALGMRHKLLGQVEKAEERFSESVRVNPSYAKSQYDLALILKTRGKLEEAMIHYKAALEAEPDYADAHNNLGVALVEVGKVNEAIPHYRRALETMPRDANVHYNLGVALFQLTHLEESQKHYREAIRIDPDHAEARNNLAIALATQGKLPQAIQQFMHVVRLKPRHAEAHNNLGIALAKSGDLTSARRHFLEAIRIAPGYQQAKRNLDLLTRGSP